MKTFPLPATLAVLAAFVAAPFSLAAGGMLFLTAGLGFIIHADYTLRFRRVRMPKAPRLVATTVACATFRCEDRCLAA